LALVNVAASKPHAAYCAFTHGLIGRWVYTMRIPATFFPNHSRMLFIYSFFLCQLDIPHVPLQKAACFLFHVHFGGLGVVNLTSVHDSQFAASKKITGPLKYLIKQFICAHLPEIRHMLLNLRKPVLYIAYRQVLRKAGFNYSKCCSSPMAEATSIEFSHIIQQYLTFKSHPLAK